MRPVCSRRLGAQRVTRSLTHLCRVRCHNPPRCPGVTCVSRNIEIKAHIASVATLLPQVQALADQGPFEILQDDTYFVCNAGKLKLRMFSPDRGELIYYQRARSEEHTSELQS